MDGHLALDNEEMRVRFREGLARGILDKTHGMSRRIRLCYWMRRRAEIGMDGVWRRFGQSSVGRAGIWEKDATQAVCPLGSLLA